MADNITLNSGSGGSTLATDDIGGTHYQIVKLTFGALDAQTIASSGSGAVDAGTQRVTVATDDTVTVDNAGTFAAQIDGAALTALQIIDNPVFADDAAFTLASSSVSMAGAIRDDALTTLTAVEGDAVPLRVSSTGALHVTGGGGGTEYNEDDATPATIVGTASLMERDDALTTLTPIEGDWAAFRCSAEGALWVQDFNSDAILADTANIDTNVGTIAGAVTGTEMQVDVVAALPAGTNNIGDVDVLSVIPGTAATNLGKAIDSAAGATDTGVAPLAIRDDALSALTPIEGDYAPLRVDSNGALWVNSTAGGTHVDDAAFTPGTDDGVPIFATFDDTTPDSVDEGDAGVLRMSANRNLYSTIRDAAGNERGANVDASNRLQVLADLGATDNAVLDQIEVNTSYGDNTGNGTATGALRVTMASDSTGQVQLAAGSASIGTLGANSGVDIGDVDVTSIAAGSNLVGDVGISGTRTSGGTTLYKNIDVDETEDEIKGTAGQVYWIHAVNLSAATLFLKFYNATAATVVVGTTVPDLTFPIPTQGDTNGAGFTISMPNGIAFGTAITIACTTGVADNDSGAPGANACVVNLGYA